MIKYKKNGGDDPITERDKVAKNLRLPPSRDMDSGLHQQFITRREKGEFKPKSLFSYGKDFLRGLYSDKTAEQERGAIQDYIFNDKYTKGELFPEVYPNEYTRRYNNNLDAVSVVHPNGNIPEREKANANFSEYFKRASEHRAAARRGEKRPSNYAAPGYRLGGVLYKK